MARAFAVRVLLAAWIAGTASFLLRMIFGLQQVRALRRFGLPWCGGQSIVNQRALDAGIQRRVEVLLHELCTKIPATFVPTVRQHR